MVRGAGFEPEVQALKVRDLQKATHSTTHLLPADLAEVVERWEKLPESLRAGILAMVRAQGI